MKWLDLACRTAMETRVQPPLLQHQLGSGEHSPWVRAQELPSEQEPVEPSKSCSSLAARPLIGHEANKLCSAPTAARAPLPLCPSPAQEACEGAVASHQAYLACPICSAIVDLGSAARPPLPCTCLTSRRSGTSSKATLSPLQSPPAQEGCEPGGNCRCSFPCHATYLISPQVTPGQQQQQLRGGKHDWPPLRKAEPGWAGLRDVSALRGQG